MDENEDAEEIEKKIEKSSSGSSEAVAGNVMNHNNALRLAEQEVKTSTKNL